MQTLRNTSQFALLPVFILLLGIGEASKIAITFYSSIFFLLINTISGVKSVDPLLLKAARSMGTSDIDMFRKVILPASIPSIVSGMRLAVKASIFAVIGAEMLAAKSGLGFLIQQSQLMMETADMYAGIITMTAIGLLVNYLLVWFERWATAWKAVPTSPLPELTSTSTWSQGKHRMIVFNSPILRRVVLSGLVALALGNLTPHRLLLPTTSQV